MAEDFFAAFANGSVRFVPDTLPWSDFMALLTISGKEYIPPW
jgi:hypothetical protein